jgi:hypothetical protein
MSEDCFLPDCFLPDSNIRKFVFAISKIKVSFAFVGNIQNIGFPSCGVDSKDLGKLATLDNFNTKVIATEFILIL